MLRCCNSMGIAGPYLRLHGADPAGKALLCIVAHDLDGEAWDAQASGHDEEHEGKMGLGGIREVFRCLDPFQGIAVEVAVLADSADGGAHRSASCFPVMAAELIKALPLILQAGEDERLELLRGAREAVEGRDAISSRQGMHDLAGEEGPVGAGTAADRDAVRACLRAQQDHGGIMVRDVAKGLQICKECVARSLHGCVCAS